MASPEIRLLANSDQTIMSSDSTLESPQNLSESDLNFIRKIQMINSIPGVQTKTRTVFTPKSAPEILCTCPQKCDEKIPMKVRTYMFKYYHAMNRDRPKQELLLLRFIEMKSLAQRLKEDNKRVQCRYKAPTCIKAIDFVFEDESVNLSEDEENENKAQFKGKKSKAKKKKKKPEDEEEVQFDAMVAMRTDPSIKYKIDKYGYTEVCQKAFMNVFAVPEKRVRAVRERLVASKRVHLEREMKQAALMNAELETAVKIAQDLAAGCKPLLQMLSQNQNLPDEEEPNDISSQLLDAIDSDIELVNNFFYNQLWKPEIFDKSNGKKNSKLNGLNKTTTNTMSNSLLDETFDSVISAAASMAEDSENTMNGTNQTADLNDTGLEGISQLNDNYTDTEASHLETTAEANDMEDSEMTDPLSEDNEAKENDKEASSPDAPESDMEVANDEVSSSGSNPSEPERDPLADVGSSDVATLNGEGEQPLNLNIAAQITTIPAPPSPDVSSNGDDTFGTAIDLSVPSPHRDSNPLHPNEALAIFAKQNVNTTQSRSQTNSRHNFSTKVKPPHRNGNHRSDPMRKSSPSIQNILNNHQQALFSPNLLPAALFDSELGKYLSGLESSISITAPKSSTSRRPRHQTPDPMSAAQLTAQLIQSALNQSSLSVSANPATMSNSAAMGAKYNSSGFRSNERKSNSMGGRYNGHPAQLSTSSLNQLLNIPDSVSITPALVNNSK